MELQLKHVESDSSQQVTKLESRTRSLAEDTRNQLSAQQLKQDGEREKLETRLTTGLQRSLVERDNRLVSRQNIA